MKQARTRPALIIANGDIPPRSVLRPIIRSIRPVRSNSPVHPMKLRRATRHAPGIVVCADGGARHAKTLGIRPDLIIGDLDSVTPEMRKAYPGVPIVRNPDQESTDLEKAIRYCIASKCSPVVVIGAVGDRIDHSIGALGCLRKFGRKLDLRLLDRSGELRLLPRSATLIVRRKETFSLIPLRRCGGIVLRGALYPLKGESLELGVREGTSNRTTGTRLSVRHSSGWLLLYRFHRKPAGDPRRGAPKQ